MTLKPTIRNGQWVYLPPPPQDAPYLARHAAQADSKPKEKSDERASLAKAS